MCSTDNNENTFRNRSTARSTDRNLGIHVAGTNRHEVPVGLLLRERKGKMSTRPQCSWCNDVQLPNDVAFFSTKRAGQAGRNGDTIGILACANFECSANVRKLPSVAYIGFDVEAARQRRIEALGEHVRNFLRDVRNGS